MMTICFYQDSRHDQPLYWIQKQLCCGYISKRNDGMTELRINGYHQCSNVLKALEPFIHFKKQQVKAMLVATRCLEGKVIKNLSIASKKRLLDCIMQIQNHNYQSKHKRSKKLLEKLLGLTP